MGTYVPGTLREQQQMLESLGCSSIEELFTEIPKDVRMNGPLNLPDGLSELEVRNKIGKMAGKNKVFSTIYRGCGAYNHYIPSIVKQITSKEEFVSAYTPYQAEISQGILQSIFEYQTMICELTGMDVSNASVYDGATAAAEAVIMCVERKRSKALVSETMNPQTIETIRTYCTGANIELVLIASKDGKTDLDKLKSMVDESTACVLVQQPNYYGQIEDCDEIGNITKESGAKYVISSNPISLAIIKTPAEYGADVAVGEGQALGIPLSFGGPYLGFMAATEKMMRKLPGRIAGETKDAQGRRAYVLTLQAREQHIRREKASSNICSNQALCAMTAAVYMGAMGEAGLRNAACLSYSKAHYLAEQLCGLENFEMAYTGDFFNEFVSSYKGNVEDLMEQLEVYGILGGYPIDGTNHIIWCTTEMNTKEEIDALIDILKEVDGK